MAEVLLDSEKQNTPERGVSSILEQQEKIEDYINSGNLNKLDLLGNNGEINRKFERHRGDFIKQIQFEKHTKETANTFANSGGNEYSLMGSLITTELNDQSQNQNTSIDKKYIEEELAKKKVEFLKQEKIKFLEEKRVLASISYYSGDFDEIPDNSKYKGKAYNPDYGDEQVLSDFAKKTLEEIKNRPLNNFSSMDDLRFKIKQSEINSMKPIQDIPEEPEDESILDNIKQIGNTIVDISSATAQGVEFAVDNYNVFKSSDHIKLSDDMLNFQTKFDLISKFDDEKTGFSAMLVSNKADGKLTLVIRGTDDKKDMKDDYNFQTKDHLPNQVLSGINYLESLKKQGFIGENKKIDLVGHSLGGGLAQIIGVMYKGGKEDLVGNVYTFNAPGVAELDPSFDYKKTNELKLTELSDLDYVQKRYLNIYKNRIRGYNDKDNVDPEGDFDYIINIGNSGDVVNGLGKKLGKTYQTTQDTHGINTIFVDKIDNLDTINNINTNQTSV